MLCLGLVLAAATAAPVATHETFTTADLAAQALIAAAEHCDVAALTRIFGPDGVDLVVTKDAVQDKARCAAFSEKAKEKTKVVRDPKNSKSATLIIGAEDWPMPVPIVQTGGRWAFDSKAGRQEILFRRIGENELSAIAVCHGYVDAQNEYASERHDGAIPQYAQHVISTPGKHDGLAWPTPAGTWEGPMGEDIARFISEGHTSKTEPYNGYYFKILKGQGPAAPMGAMDFVVKGAMIGGFALAAAPADYGLTGVKTFMVSHTGTVYEKDLGPDTLKKFQAMTIFDPDKTWTPVSGD